MHSTPWIPDSKYWIPVFVSGTWNLDSQSLLCIPVSRTQDSGFQKQNFLGFQLKQKCSGFPYIMRGVASTKTLIMISVTSFASSTTNNAASDIPCMGCKSVAFEIDSLHCVFAKLGDKVKMRSGSTLPFSVFLIKLQIFISICMRGRIPLVRGLCCSQGCRGFDWGPAKTRDYKKIKEK